MRTLATLLLLSFHASAQPAAFAVASVKPSSQTVGPDYNNNVSLLGDSISARNVTLKRLVMEAFQLLPHQVLGPNWLSDNEFDLEAKADAPASREQMRPMLQALLKERFGLAFHREKREMNVYVLVQGKGGPKIHPVKDGETAGPGGQEHFHGELQQFADLLGVRLSIADRGNPDPTKPMIATGTPDPVIDRTGLLGTYDFSLTFRPEDFSDVFTFWPRALEEQLGLRLEKRREQVEVLVVDRAERTPTSN